MAGVGSLLPASTPPLGVTHDYDNRRSVQEPWTAVEFTLEADGGSFAQGTIAQNALSFDGECRYEFTDDFYDFVYFIPASVEVESVSTTQNVAVQVWNAFRQQRTLTTITETGFDGITLSGSPLEGGIFEPLGLYDYTLQIIPAGAPNINALLTFDIDGGAITTSLPITGRRIGQFFALPNWTTPVTKQWSYLSDIAAGRTLKEQRRQLRETPRISLSYQHTMLPHRLRAYTRFFADAPDQLTSMPDWVSKAETIGVTTIGSQVFNVGTVPAWAAVGQLVFIQAPQGNKDEDPEVSITAIDSIGAGSITVTATSTREWPVGTIIYKGFVGRLSDDTQASLVTNFAGESTIEFEIDPSQEALSAEPAATEFFLSREVLTLNNNWARVPTITFSKPREVVDFGRGRVQTDSFQTGTRFNLELGFLGLDLDNTLEVESFFRRQLGRVKEFWRSTGVPDILVSEMTEDLTAGSSALTLSTTELFDIYSEDTFHKAIEIRLKDGTVLRKSILDWTTLQDPDRTQIVFNETFVDEVLREDIDQISWLLLWRLASDDMSMEWLTDQTGQTVLTLRSLEVEDPE